MKLISLVSLHVFIVTIGNFYITYLVYSIFLLVFVQRREVFIFVFFNYEDNVYEKYI